MKKDALNHFYSDKKCLITGASGFVGQRLVKALIRQNAKITIIQHKKRVYFEEKVKIIEADLCKKMPEPDSYDMVFHLAGSVLSRNILGLNKNIPEKNSRAFANWLLRCKTPKLIFLSSIMACGGAKKNEKIDEYCHTLPFTTMGNIKKEAEDIFLDSYDHKRLIIIRSSPIYGKESRVLMPFKISRALRFFPCFKNFFPLIHIDDLIDALLLAGLSNKSGFFILADGQKYNMSSLFSQKSARNNKRYFPVNTRVIEDILHGLGPFCPEAIAPFIWGNWVCDIKRAEDELNFFPKRKFKL